MEAVEEGWWRYVEALRRVKEEPRGFVLGMLPAEGDIVWESAGGRT